MKRDPKVKEHPNYRQPTHQKDPESCDQKQIRFRFDLLDFDHSLWGWNNLDKEQFVDVLKFIKTFEKQTWAEVKQTAGGRKQGTNHHSLEISEFCKRARDRLSELKLDHIIGDTLFSIRIKNCTRIYGLREDEFCRIIWYDPHHGNPTHGAYPTKH